MCNGQFLNSGDMWKFAQFLVLIQIVNYAQAQIACKCNICYLLLLCINQYCNETEQVLKYLKVYTIITIMSTLLENINIRLTSSIIIFCYFLLIVTGLPCTVRNPKIVGGSEAERNEMPFMVSLMRRGGHFCGGTIIHERWILTAGHCICNGLQNFMKPTQIQGVVGVHSIRDYLNAVSDGPQGFRVDFKRIVPHPQYDCKNVQHDIGKYPFIYVNRRSED